MKTVAKNSTGVQSMRRARTRRRTCGSTFVELAVAIGLMTAMVLFAVDICLLLVAYGVNDRACRDAARAAAQGKNQSEALNLAKAALKIHDLASVLVDTPQIDEGAFAYVTNPSGQGGQPGQAYVSVTTRTTTKIPAPIFLLGQNVGGEEVSIARSYTYPIVKLSKTQP